MLSSFVGSCFFFSFFLGSFSSSLLASSSDRVGLYHYEPCESSTFFPKKGNIREVRRFSDAFVLVVPDAGSESPDFLKPEEAAESSFESAVPDNILKLVLDPSQWPYTSCRKLLSKFSTEEPGYGSGSLIGPRHFLTAAHNLYDSKKREWAKRVSVLITASDSSDEEVGIGYYIYKDLWNSVNKGGNEFKEFDMALVVLLNSVGEKIGYGGVLAIDEVGLLMGKTLQVVGYPKKETRLHVGFSLLSSVDVSDGLVCHGIECPKGMSGGSVRLAGKGDFKHHIVGINTNDFSFFPISTQRLRDISHWMNLSGEVSEIRYPKMLHEKMKVTSFCYSKEGHRFAVAIGREIYLYNHDLEGEMLPSGHIGSVRSLIFHPHGDSLVSGGRDGRVFKWNISLSPITSEPIESDNMETWCLSFDKDGTQLAYGGFGGYHAKSMRPKPNLIYIWNYHEHIMLPPLEWREPIYTLSFRYNSNTDIFFGGADHKIYYWGPDKSPDKSGAPRCKGDHTNVVYAIEFHPNRDIFASGSADSTIKIWEIQASVRGTTSPGTVELTKKLEGHKSQISSLAFHPTESILVSGSYGGEVFFWNYRGRTTDTIIRPIDLETPFKRQSEAIIKVAFSRDGRNLISGSASGGIVSTELWPILDKRGSPVFLSLLRERAKNLEKFLPRIEKSKSSLILPRETDGLFNEDPYIEPKVVIERVICSDKVFDRLETSTVNFNCGFYSLGLSRLQATNLLLRNLHDLLVLGYVGDQIFTVLSANDVHQLPGDQAPYEEIRAVFRERYDLQTVFDAESQEVFNAIEESSGARPHSLAEAILFEELGPVIIKNLHDLQGLEIAIQAKDLECRDACKTEDIVRHYIRNFVAQPYKTMEFQHDQGERATHCVLDAIAYLQGYSLNIYQRVDGQNIILRHKFVHPVPGRERKHIFHEGGGGGSIGHFTRLDVVE